jgi:hypothetical protein
VAAELDPHRSAQGLAANFTGNSYGRYLLELPQLDR